MRSPLGTTLRGACLVLLAASAARGGPVAFPPHGTTGEPGAVLVTSVGVYRRTLNLDGGGQADLFSRQLVARAAFSPVSRVDLYLLGGVGDAEIVDSGFAGRADGLWGGGAKLALLDPALHDVNVALDLQADTFQSEMGGANLRVIEAQATPCIVSRWDQLSFTGGLRLSQVQVKESWRADKTDVSRDLLGFALGLDYYVHPNVGFTGELHVFDENAVFLGVGYRF